MMLFTPLDRRTASTTSERVGSLGGGEPSEARAIVGPERTQSSGNSPQTSQRGLMGPNGLAALDKRSSTAAYVREQFP